MPNVIATGQWRLIRGGRYDEVLPLRPQPESTPLPLMKRWREMTDDEKRDYYQTHSNEASK